MSVVETLLGGERGELEEVQVMLMLLSALVRDGRESRDSTTDSFASSPPSTTSSSFSSSLSVFFSFTISPLTLQARVGGGVPEVVKH